MITIAPPSHLLVKECRIPVEKKIAIGGEQKLGGIISIVGHIRVAEHIGFLSGHDSQGCRGLAELYGLIDPMKFEWYGWKADIILCP